MESPSPTPPRGEGSFLAVFFSEDLMSSPLGELEGGQKPVSEAVEHLFEGRIRWHHYSNLAVLNIL